LLLGGVAVLFAAAGAHADLIAGCCDSLTHLESGDPGYLPWIQDVYGIGEVENQAVGARWSGAGLTALEGYLAAEDPQVVVVLSGTVDAFIGPTWQPGGSPLYDEEQTVGNIVDMVAAILADGATPILVAPPPVYPPCDGSVNPSCLTIEDRLASLARALESEVADPSSAAHGVAFVDLQAVFASYPDPYSLYDDGWNDGLHPDDEGDRVIAQAVLDELGPVVGAPCEDGVDNDGDGYVDFPGDAGCDGPSDWSEGLAVLECEDGVDNDGDGAIDLDDFGCQGQGDFSERTAPDGIACDDGIDNDGDGSIDYPGDAGCGSPVQTEENPGCNDGIDNDGDGLIDFDGGDSLDLDRDGYVDPEFNPAEPEVTDPTPAAAAAPLNRKRRARLGGRVSPALAAR
jgi:lysophospholipase L1-like esterase